MKFLVILIGVVLLYILLKQLFTRSSKDPTKPVQDTPKKIAQAPEGWQQFYQFLLTKPLPSIDINILDTPCSHIEQSRFGGKPYWPIGKSYPLDPDGQPLVFIAQINLSELPKGFEQLPNTGMLQFFIGNNDVFGAEFLTDNKGLNNHLAEPKQYAVIYHPELNDAVDIFDKKVVEAHQSEHVPVSGETALTFVPINDVASPHDYRFKRLIAEYGILKEEFEQYAFDTLVDLPAHKLGGYGYFTQEDPRAYLTDNDQWLLLFQMDSQVAKSINIMWGDMGVANFFIRQDDLKSLSFDKVWFNWDCS